MFRSRTESSAFALHSASVELLTKITLLLEFRGAVIQQHPPSSFSNISAITSDFEHAEVIQEAEDLATLVEGAQLAKVALDEFCRTLVTKAGLRPDGNPQVGGKRVGKFSLTEAPYLRYAEPMRAKGGDLIAAEIEHDHLVGIENYYDAVSSHVVLENVTQLEAVVEGLLEGSSSIDVISFADTFSEPRYTGIGKLEVLLSVAYFGTLGEVKKHVCKIVVELVAMRKAEAEYDSELESTFRCLDSSKGVTIVKGLGEGVIDDRVFASFDSSILTNLDMICGKEMLRDYFIQLQCRQQLLNIVVDNEEARLRLTLDLGSSYTDLHEYGTAMPLLEEALAGFNKLKGGSGKVTLLCLHTLAVAHMRMGEVAKSIELGEKALKGREKVLGANHQDTLRSVNNLAMAYYGLENFEKASELYERALDAWTEQLGWEHTNTLMTCNGLAGVYFSSKEYERSIEMYDLVVKGFKKSMGQNHPLTLIAIANLANVYKKTDEHEKALGLFETAMKGNEKTKGIEHADTLAAYSDLASSYESLVLHDKAILYYHKALRGQEASLGRDHPATLDTANELGAAYYSKGDLEMCAKLYQRVLTGREKNRKDAGAPDETILDTMNNLASVLKKMGKLKEALALFDDAANGYEAVQGEYGVDVAMTTSNIGDVLVELGDLDRGIDTLRHALDLQRSRQDDAFTLLTMHRLAKALFEIDRVDEALTYAKLCMSSRERVFGIAHCDTKASMELLSAILVSQSVDGLMGAMHPEDNFQGEDEDKSLQKNNRELKRENKKLKETLEKLRKEERLTKAAMKDVFFWGVGLGKASRKVLA